MMDSVFPLRFVLLLLVACRSIVDAINPEDDFEGYMETLEKRQMEHKRMEDIFEKHEAWRQSTWQGWCVRQLQKIGDHFLPFIDAVSAAMGGRDGKHTPQQVATTIILRALMVFAYVVCLYAVSRVLNMLFDKEIVIEDEVIIEHEDESSIPDGAILINGSKQHRPRGRSKKDKKKDR